MRGKRNWRFGRAGWLMFGLLWLMIAPALAATADVARGLTWLQGQVQSSGQLATPSKLAFPTQAQPL